MIKKLNFVLMYTKFNFFYFLFINTKLKRGIFNKITPYKWLKTVKNMISQKQHLAK